MQEAQREAEPASILLDDRPLEAKIRVRGPLARRDDGRWVVTDNERKGALAFSVALPTARATALLRRESVSALANRWQLPSGILEGILVHEPARVLYLFERILDVPAFTPAERLGFSVRQVTTDRRGIVTSGVGRTIYEVPVEIRHGNVAITLLPGQTDTMVVARARYRVSVHLSRFAVVTNPDYPLEEAASHIEYTISAI